MVSVDVKHHVYLLYTDRMNAALSLESSIMWVGTTEFCVCSCHSINEIYQQLYSVCSYSLRLSQSVLSFHYSYLIKTSF